MLLLPGVLLVLSVLMKRKYLPVGLMQEYLIASVFACSLAGGIYAQRRRGRGAAVVGAVSGVIMFFPFLLFGVLHPECVIGADALRLFLSALVGGAAGGALAIGQKKQKSRHIRKKNNRMLS